MNTIFGKTLTDRLSPLPVMARHGGYSADHSDACCRSKSCIWG